ncbi:MAG: putative porin, partial [candidate division Zixibacteria bacterium]|nr:putative porin [candidate division Zixibacteria bacterium]
NVKGGKFKNPFFKPGKSELIWDGDWNPEGGVAAFKKKSGDFDLTLIGAGLWIDERSSSDDSYIAAGQAVGRIHFNEKKSHVAIGGSIFNYVNAEGFEPFFDHDDAMGNSIVEAVSGEDTVEVYASGFELMELFGEFTHKFESTPVTVMFDYVTNSAADSLNTGWLFGLRVGKAKKPGSWEFRYIYRNLEADAVLGMFTDSDFRGGGTDAKGHEVGGAIQLAANTAFKASYFINEIGLEAEETEGFNRMQIDLQLKF